MKLNRLLLGGALLLTHSLSAQQLESSAGVRFQFEAPGARSAAMGGASEALTDTFSTNPAALAHIRQRRIAIDARRTSNSTEFITGGTVGAFETISLDAKSSGIQAATVLLPTRAATFALFVDEPLHTMSPTAGLRSRDQRIEVGLVGEKLVPISECRQVVNDCNAIGFLDTPVAFRAASRVTLRRIGTAVGFNIGTLSLGGAVHYAELDQKSDAYGDSVRGNDRRVTWSGGAQWQISPVIRAGASYRSGATFDSTHLRTFPDSDRSETKAATFRTPTSYGAGIAFDLAPNLTVAVDAQRVRYSEMIEPHLALGTSFGIIPLVMPDVTELHAGAEYRIGTRIPVAVRAGWWRDPSHRLRAIDTTYTGSPGDFFFPAAFINLGLLDEDEDHVTAGIGVGDRLRLDAAIDKSEHTTRGSLTLATTF